MIKTTSEVFLETKEVFRKQAEDAIQEALDKIYTEYLPHVETDTNSNVYFQCCDWLRRFVADELRADDFIIGELDIRGVDIRRKMFKENREELSKVIGKDIIERLEYFESFYKTGDDYCYAHGQRENDE